MFFWIFYRLQRSQSPTLALSQLGRGVNWSVDDQVMGFRDHHGDFLEQNIAVKDRTEERSNSGEEETVLHLQTSVLSHEASVTETLPPSVEFTTSRDSGSLFSDETEAADPSLPSDMFESGVLQPLIFANDMTDLQLNVSDVKSHSDLAVVLDTTELPPLSGPLYSVYNQVTQDFKADGELLKVEKLIGSNFLIEEPSREDIYMFYEDTKSSSQMATSSRTSHLYNQKFSSVTINGVSRGAELMLEDSRQIAGNDFNRFVMVLPCFSEQAANVNCFSCNPTLFPQKSLHLLVPCFISLANVCTTQDMLKEENLLQDIREVLQGTKINLEGATIL